MPDRLDPALLAELGAFRARSLRLFDDARLTEYLTTLAEARPNVSHPDDVVLLDRLIDDALDEQQRRHGPLDIPDGLTGFDLQLLPLIDETRLGQFIVLLDFMRGRDLDASQRAWLERAAAAAHAERARRSGDRIE